MLRHRTNAWVHSEAANTAATHAFTLIELLAVMAIMMIMAGIAVASYFGVTRGSGMRTAAAHLQSTLLLARQNAVMNGVRTCVMFECNATNTWYVVVPVAGKTTYGSGQVMRDDYSDLSQLTTASTLYNLRMTTSDQLKVRRYSVSAIDPVTQRITTAPVPPTSASWSKWDAYGWETNPRSQFPMGYQFGTVTPIAPSPVVFDADGTPRKPDGTVLSGDQKMEIYEKIHAASGDPRAVVTVKGMTGLVTVEFVQ